MKFIKLLPLLLVFFTTPIFSQTVTIDHHTQRFLGTISELDRQRYFTVHSNSSDADHTTFYNDYNVSRGRGFWGPFSYANSETGTVGNYPAYQSGGTELRNVSRFISTEHPYNVVRWNLDKTTAANWVVEYWKDFVDDNGRPEFFEPMNEPFVHAGDAEFSAQQPDQDLMRYRMAEWFGEIGEKIHAAPELANMKVIGYSSAWPSMELWDFGHWDTRMKMFMDVAGEHMDAFAVHLYDGVNVVGQNSARSGSNSEAILDLVEAYSYIKWGIVKDHAISEYGAIETGYGDNYSDLASIQSVRSINHILFNLLEREDKMAISIPFITGKGEWHINAANNYQPYQAVLFKPSNIGQPNPTGWVYTPRIHFYELWKEVKGNRVAIATDHPDIQIQAFADGSKLYVALNNLDDITHTVNLDFTKGLSGLQSVNQKSLKIYPNQMPVLSNTTQSTSPGSITLIDGETTVLEYTFGSPINFDNAIRSKKYYANTYLQDITANLPMTFTYSGVTTGTGKASLRLSIGRKHNVSKSPVVMVNGTAVPVPTNWKGYDQANRTDFFGVIEIPVPANLLQATNTVTVTFPDSGGQLASLILQAELYDNLPIAQRAYPNGVPHTIPGLIECEDFDIGGQGIAYHDTDPNNQGNVYRTTEGVDVNTSTEGGYKIGWTVTDEWLEYTVNVTQAGTYQAAIRYTSGAANPGQIYLEFDGEDKTGLINLPPTGGWEIGATVYDSLTLEVGEYVMRTYIAQSGLDLNKITFTLVTPAVDLVAFNNPPIFLPSTVEHTFLVDYEAFIDREIFVELWSPSGWIATSSQVVTAGTGTASITINLATALASGTGYYLKANIRPVGGDWTTALDNVTATDITVFGDQAPYNGLLRNIPGLIQAEDYDEGGQGVAYYDTTPNSNTGGEYRTDGVDIELCCGNTSGTYNIGWGEAGEWLEYTVYSSESLTYDFFLHVASPNTTGQLKLLIDGVDQTGILDVPLTGDWQNYSVIHLRDIDVTAGIHVVRIEFVNAGVNLDKWAAWPAPFLDVRTKVLLEGPYNTTDLLMKDDLRVNTMIPTVEPYSALGYTYVNATSGEIIEDPTTVFAVTGDNAIVDWVFLELRDATDSTVVLATRSALLQRDGDVVDMDGISPVNFQDLSDGMYYLAVHHRNHLSVMTANPINLSNSSEPIDFTDPSLPLYGANARTAVGSVMALWAGDAVGDGTIDALDRGATWNTRNQSDYLEADLNMDGTCDALDRGISWNNRNHTAQMPE